MQSETSGGSSRQSNIPPPPLPPPVDCRWCIKKREKCCGCGFLYWVQIKACNNCKAGITRPWNEGNRDVVWESFKDLTCPSGMCLGPVKDQQQE